MAAALVYRLTIIKTVYSQFKLKRIQGGWYKLCEASGVRSTQQGRKEKLSQQNAILNDPFSIKMTIEPRF